MKHIVVIDITDTTDGFADDFLDVDDRADGRLLANLRNADFATDDDDIAFHEGLASHAALGIDRKAGVKNGVRDGVGDFVWMAFANGFRGKNVGAHVLF